MVWVAWRGPSVVKDIYDFLGCSLLMLYFTNTCVSPLQKRFVETDDPHASNVDYFLYSFSTTSLIFYFENVPKDKIPHIKDLLVKVLEDTCNAGDGAIDMKRMRNIVHKRILWDLDSFDNNPHDTIADILFRHVLYGDTKEDVRRYILLAINAAIEIQRD